MTDIRPSPIAGTWYPGAPDVLAQSVDAYLEQAQVEPPPGDVIAVVAPHAGHRYSGPVAGHAFKTIPAEVDTAVVISPLHHLYSGTVFTTAHAAYATPLGEIPVDQAALDRIERSVPLTRIPRDPEHALEIELPFLQRRLKPGFNLIPLMLREQTPQIVQQLAGALAPILKDRHALLVGSSDLSHFYPQAAAERLDQYVLGRIAAFDPIGVLEAEESGKGFACGRGAIAAVMLTAQQLGATSARVVNYGTSGDTTGDYTRVVGYGAAVIWKGSSGP